ncbi:MAG TPA: HNH endonuclease signature motif containing protein [Solirubrobacteraceae bacterium]|nr:HNH endonuclease signature motif containing protein [Solirubrobacteraceae bacterium]HUB74485.1 HNH endonuclease signature motif containing protein [Solirubrobacteraceae bacterium]
MSQPLTEAPTRDGRTYGAAWRRRRARYARKVGNRCEVCGSTEALEVHHVDPLGSDDDDNLELLCARDHRLAEAERTVSINVMKVTEADALAQVRSKYRTHPGALRGAA